MPQASKTPSPPTRLTLVETARLAAAALRSATTNERRKATQRRRATRVGGWRHFTGPARVLPDAVIVGAQRAGTSSLYEGIVAHPDVEPPIRKEVHYFDRFWGRGEYWYRGHFPTERQMQRRTARRGRRPLTLEGTPMYMFRPVATERLARTLPAARLIAVLRNPVARAFSQYRLVRSRDPDRPWTFDEAYRLDPVWSEAAPDVFMRDPKFPRAYRFLTPPLLARGLYVYQLERLFSLVPRSQVLVVSAEQMYADEMQFFRRVYEFLDLDPIEPDFDRVRPPRGHPMLPETRETLQAFFAPHNERLFELLGVDFGWNRAEP